MSYVTWEIKHTPFDNNGWDGGDTTTLTEFHSPVVRVQMGDAKDSFSFKVTNTFDDYDAFFEPNDRITVSRILNSTTVTTSDIIMVGTIKDVPQIESYAGETLTVEGYNYSEIITQAIVFVDFQNKTVDQALKDAVANAAQTNPNFTVTWHPSNPSLKTNDDAFPTVDDDRFYYKPLRNIIEKYSTNQYTGDGDYYWYVDEDNKFVWRPKTGDVDDTLDASTENYYSLQIGKDIKGIRNYVILKGGHDPAGNQIMTRYINWSSVNTVGVKFHFLISENNKSRNLIQQDLRQSYGDDIGTNTVPTFPFTTSWKARFTYTTKNEGVSVTAGSAVYVTSAAEYIEVIRTEIKKRLVEEGKLFAENMQYGKLTLQFAFPSGAKTWGLGTNLQCTVPKIRTLPFTMRVTEILYQDSDDTFVLTEDEGTLGQGSET